MKDVMGLKAGRMVLPVEKLGHSRFEKQYHWKDQLGGLGSPEHCFLKELFMGDVNIFDQRR